MRADNIKRAVSALSRAGVKITEGLPLCEYGTMRVGGAARLAVFPASAEELSAATRLLCESETPFCVIGRGSNVIFPDRGCEGAIVFTQEMKSISRLADNTVSADCGASLTALSAFAAEQGLAGLEFAYGIPGSVGGAVYMNAGAYGGSVSDVLLSSEILRDGEAVSVSASSHGFGYRKSAFSDSTDIILRSFFKLYPADGETALNKCRENMAARLEKQPLDFPSAGSFFKRPDIEGVYASRLIDECGLRGFTVGGAAVSKKHAGFIVNLGNASAGDIRELSSRVRDIVLQKTGIELKEEVIFISESCSRL